MVKTNLMRYFLQCTNTANINYIQRLNNLCFEKRNTTFYLLRQCDSRYDTIPESFYSYTVNTIKITETHLHSLFYERHITVSCIVLRIHFRNMFKSTSA